MASPEQINTVCKNMSIVGVFFSLWIVGHLNITSVILFFLAFDIICAIYISCQTHTKTSLPTIYLYVKFRETAHLMDSLTKECLLNILLGKDNYHFTIRRFDILPSEAIHPCKFGMTG